MLICDKTVLGRMACLALILFGCLLSSVHAQQSSLDGLVLKTPEIPAKVTGVLRSLNESLSAKIDPAENAVVHLVQIFGAEAFDPPLRDDSLAMLGIGQVSATAPLFVYPEAFISSISTPTNQKTYADVDLLMSQLRECGEKVWKRVKYPMVSEFLATNQLPLDLVVKASQQPKYYAPMLAETEPPRLLSASLAIERRLPFLAHVLTARAMSRFSENDVAGAMSDVLAAQRLAVLLSMGSPFDVSASKAQVIDNITYRALTAMLESGKLTGDDAKMILQSLKELPSFPYPELAADQGERAIVHQEVELFREEDQTVREFFELGSDDASVPETLRVTDLPLKSAIQGADEIQSRFVQALAIRDRKLQSEAFQKLDRDYDQWQQTSDEKTLAVLKTINEDKDAVSRWMGETIAYSLRPWYWQRRMADDRVRTRREIVTVGAALVAFQRENEKYPENLAELVPKFLEAIPNDAHSDKPFLYERTSDTVARLQSWGSNQTNDAGQRLNDDLILELK